MEENENPTIWLVSWNPESYYDLEGVIEQCGETSWRYTKNMKTAKVGDLVYIYASLPQKAIRYKLVITDFVNQEYINAPAPEAKEGEAAADENNEDNEPYFIFDLIQGYSTDYMPLEKMVEYGIKPTSLTGPHRLKPEENEGVRQMIEKLDNVPVPDIEPNMILYGPPGTGKTYNAAIYAESIYDLNPEDGKAELEAGLKEKQSQDYSDILYRLDDMKEKEHAYFTTFHQSYGYEDFIEGIKPITENGQISYPLKAGVFRKACHMARIFSDIPIIFIIDEINRGNVSKIFGELITLLEKSKREGASEAMSVRLPGSQEHFSVPRNLFIIGTMNTADRSIALMDTALRRRFSFIEMMPKPELLNDVIIESDQVKVNVGEMLRTINRRIEVLYDREHTLGHSYFMKLKQAPAVEALAEIFKEKIIPLLQEYFYEDYGRIQLVLGDNEKSSPDYQFISAKPLKAKNIFKGHTDIELPEVEYQLNPEALLRLESYAEILND